MSFTHSAVRSIVPIAFMRRPLLSSRGGLGLLLFQTTIHSSFGTMCVHLLFHLSSPDEVKFLQWRLYVGIISQLQSEPKKEKKQFDPTEVDEDSEGEDDAAESGTKTAPVTVVNDPEIRKQLEEERRAQREQKQNALSEEQLARKEFFRERRETQKDSFLNDPEDSIKIFFSSHWRDKGYIQWVICLLWRVTEAELCH